MDQQNPNDSGNGGVGGLNSGTSGSIGSGGTSTGAGYASGGTGTGMSSGGGMTTGSGMGSDVGTGGSINATGGAATGPTSNSEIGSGGGTSTGSEDQYCAHCGQELGGGKGLEQFLGRLGISGDMFNNLKGSVDIDEYLNTARDYLKGGSTKVTTYTKENPAKVAAGVAALALGAGLIYAAVNRNRGEIEVEETVVEVDPNRRTEGNGGVHG